MGEHLPAGGRKLSIQPVLRPPYGDALAGFSIADEIARLHGDLAGGLNACVECCDRHCGSDRLALRYVADDGRVELFTFEQLRSMSAKVAAMLAGEGIRPGDVVAGMLPRTPALIATILGTWRAGAVYQPLFTAFGPKAIEHRIRTGATRLIVTDTANRGKLDEIPDRPRIATWTKAGAVLPDGDIDLRSVLDGAAVDFEPVPRRGDDLFMMMSTSGTTGLPKGVPVPLRALLCIGVYLRLGIDLRADDVYWNIADPGWAYGLYYAVAGPLLLGTATTFCESAFRVDAAYDMIERLGVTNLAGAPTAYRMMMAAGPEAAARIKGRLRVVSSAGEPLNPEVIRWFDAHIAAPIRDHYGQTELGMVVNNHHGLQHQVRYGSAGYTMPGFRVVVLDENNRETGPNQAGVLSIDIARSPLMWFTGYLNQETPAIADGYYRTGDTVEYEPDGSVSFIGRSDDVITSAGYRIGPFDVESALIEHPAVAEAAVVGIPDPERTEIVKAFVVLRNAAAATPELAEALKVHVRKRLSAHAYPREVAFVGELPKTPSGKVQRFLLRKAEIDRLARA